MDEAEHTFSVLIASGVLDKAAKGVISSMVLKFGPGPVASTSPRN